MRSVSVSTGAPAGALTKSFGRVPDSVGTPVLDKMGLILQADTNRHYFDRPDDNLSFIDFDWAATAEDGSHRLRTTPRGSITPSHAPHVTLWSLKPGRNQRLVTGMSLIRQGGNDAGRVLLAVPAERRATRVARPNAGVLSLEMMLQVTGETVFFDL